MSKMNEISGEDYARNKREDEKYALEETLRYHLRSIVEEVKGSPPSTVWELIERIAAEEGKQA